MRRIPGETRKTARTGGWMVAVFAAAAGIGILPAADPAAPAAGKPSGAAPPPAAAAEPAVKPLQPGDVAPDFSLAGSDGKTYTLAEFKGKRAVIVAWFPKAFTGG